MINIILILLFTLNIKAFEIIDRYEDKIKISKIENTENIFYLYQSKNGKDFDREFKEVKISNNELKGLKANTYYKLKSNKSEKKFWTLAEEPKKPGTNITFIKSEAYSIKMKVYYSGCEGALLVMTLNDELDKPIDGTEYKKNKNFKEVPNMKNTFVLGNIKDKEEIKLENLNYGIYTFSLIPFNGNEESINYKIDKNIERKTHPQLPVPKQKECESFKENVAEIRWERVEGVKYYEVTVCKDRNCNNPILEYDKADLGNGTEFTIYLEDEKKKYYWKIKAIGLYNSSEYSEVMEIDYDYINSAKK